MISALTKASRIFGREKFLAAAQKAESFLDKHLRKDDGRLFLRWCDGEAAYDGQLEDYAFYSLSMLSLYRSTFLEEYLEKAVQAADLMISLFFDREHGGFSSIPAKARP